MRSYTHTTVTRVSRDALYSTIVDIRRWPEWDAEIEATSHDGNLGRGAGFTLKPKGGPKLAMTIVEAIYPTTFIDNAHLPLGRLRTSHRFTAQADGTTRVDVEIQIIGPLAWIWDIIVARKQAAGAAEQTQSFIRYAARKS